MNLARSTKGRAMTANAMQIPIYVIKKPNIDMNFNIFSTSVKSINYAI